MKPLKEQVYFERYDADRVRTEEGIQEYIREHIRLKMKFKV